MWWQIGVGVVRSARSLQNSAMRKRDISYSARARWNVDFWYSVPDRYLKQKPDQRRANPYWFQSILKPLFCWHFLISFFFPEIQMLRWSFPGLSRLSCLCQSHISQIKIARNCTVYFHPACLSSWLYLSVQSLMEKKSERSAEETSQRLQKAQTLSQATICRESFICEQSFFRISMEKMLFKQRERDHWPPLAMF